MELVLSAVEEMMIFLQFCQFTVQDYQNVHFPSPSKGESA